MKVLMLGWELPPHNSGGLGVACYQLCKALSAKNIDIEFILPYSAEHNADFMAVRAASPKGVLEVLKSGTAYDSHKYIYSDGKEERVDLYGQQKAFENSVEHVVKLAKFDIIHAHDWLTFKAGLRAKQHSNKPLILHVHSVESDRAAGGFGNPLAREIEYMSMMLADRVIAVSAHTKEAVIREYGVPANKIDIVHNSIDRHMVEPLDGDTAYSYLAAMKSSGYRVVVSIGRLTIQKGLTNFLRAAKEVIARSPKTLFLIVGSGDQERELIELAAALGISQNVIFTGFLRGKRWRDAYAIGDLFVMPSVSEPFGLTPLEAISYGTPALISKQSGVSEVLLNCLKVDYWDINEMANKITAVVQNDSLKDELHSNSLREYEKMTWSQAADKLVELYNSHIMAGGVV
jgi:glycosyltransferase involved in cell wall biosynthesis